MGLHEAVSQTVRGFADRVRRDAIAYFICAICGLGAVILAAVAAVLSLVPVVGPIYAPLIVAGVFVLVLICTMLWRQSANGRPRAAGTPNFAADQKQAQHQAQFAQLAMIIEAVMLGYSMSRRR